MNSSVTLTAKRGVMRRAASVSIGLLLAAAIASGCGEAGSVAVVKAGSSPSSVPPEFQSACGHPGAKVEVRHVPVTVRHAACDLTGVGLSYKNYGGAYVPKQAGGVGNSSGFTLEVRPGSLDVTINAVGTPGDQ